MSKYSKCVAKIREQAGEGEISEAKALELLGDLKQKAELRAQKKSQKLEDALKDIAGEIQAQEKFNAALSKRNALLNVLRFREAVNYSKRDGNQSWGRGLQQYLERMNTQGKALTTQFVDRLYSRMVEENVWNDFRDLKGADELDTWREADNLSRGEQAKQGGVTQNEKAKKIARIWYEVNSELTALENREGAAIHQAPGWVNHQTHDPDLLRAAGIKGWGKANQETSFQVWKEFITQLNIDWERTLDLGQDKDKFLREFFRSIYTRVFTDEPDELHLDNFRRPGSTGSKASAARKLWFADADSGYKYNQRFGAQTFNQAVFQRIQSGARAASMMMHFGPDAEKGFRNTRQALLSEATQLPEFTKHEQSLVGETLDNMWNTAIGRTNLSWRPGFTRFIDNVKNWTLLSKGGALTFSMPPDRAFMDTSMTYRGATAADRLSLQFQALAIKSGDANKYYRDLYLSVNNLIGNISSNWVDEIRPTNAIGRGVHWMFKVTGFNKLNEVQHRAVADTFAHILGRDSELSFDKLSKERLSDFSQFSVTKAEWETWRKYAGTTKGLDGESLQVLTPDMADRFTSEDWDAIVKANDLTPSPANRNRAKDEFNGKMRAYFSEVIADATNDPTLRGRSIMNQGKVRGGVLRELSELFFIFKSYPINSYLRLVDRERRRTGTSDFLSYMTSEGIGGKWKVAELIAKTTALGYLSIALNDLRRGKSPKALTGENGVNWAILFNAMARGGALGIYGDFLLSEYDRNYRSFADAVLGPALGQTDRLANLFTSGKKFAYLPEEDRPKIESIAYQAERIAEDNLPFANLFYIKPILDHLIFWQLHEFLSPGVAKRRASEMERLGYQNYLTPLADPRQATTDDVLGIQEKLEALRN